ncbi:MAG: hypothetical protein BGO26_12060 [Actinobacteria bacterium 69-20]|nr:ABC transporter substrate-binding protein [Actinomycetota bacterium]OJV26631.1 MAG: hypothetical protein BGO26_12060 [Actinobacteria bacterium 69-20]
MTARRRLLLVVAAVLAVMVAGCSSAASPPAAGSSENSSSEGSTSGGSAPAPAQSGSSAPAGELTPVTVQFSYSWKGAYAPLVVADANGYFKEHGLAVTFNEGKGSQVVFSSLGNATNTFVIVPTSDAVKPINEGVPLISVATYAPVSPSGLAAKPGVELKTPADLEGKKIGLRSGADASLFFDKFLAANHIPKDKVTITNLNSAAATSAFLEGSIDVVDVFTDNELPIIDAKLGAPANFLSFGSFGFAQLGTGVIVSTAMAQSQGPVIREFLAAYTQGIEATRKDPVAAAKAIKDKVGLNLPALPVVEKQVEATVAADTPVDGHALGWASEEGWQRSAALFSAPGKPLPLAKYYTNEFLPQG